MKTMILMLTILVSTSLVNAHQISLEDTHKATAVYKGLTDEGAYLFMDSNKQELLFEELGEEVEIDLTEDDTVGKKYNITWENATTDLYDEDGEPTGETKPIKRIVKIELAK